MYKVTLDRIYDLLSDKKYLPEREEWQVNADERDLVELIALVEYEIDEHIDSERAEAASDATYDVLSDIEREIHIQREDILREVNDAFAYIEDVLKNYEI